MKDYDEQSNFFRPFNGVTTLVNYNGAKSKTELMRF